MISAPKYLMTTLVLMASVFICFSQTPKQLLDIGWQEMVKDNDTTALHYFNLAYEKAKRQKDTQSVAEALLKMGICHYGVSYSKGLEYAQLAMLEFGKLERSKPLKACEGRGKCLQLISTIHGRQGKYREAISLSKEAMAGFSKENDTTTYLGLIYHSIGACYQKLSMDDSGEYYLQLALKQRLLTHDSVYLPGSYTAVGDIEMKKGDKKQSLEYYKKALIIAESIANRQAQVSALICLGKWKQQVETNIPQAEAYYQQALKIATQLTDKVFSIKVLTQLIELKKSQGDYKQALQYKEVIVAINDALYSWDKQKATQILEVQFNVAEKNRRLEFARKEKEVIKLTNYLLASFLTALTIIGTVLVIFLRRINKRDRLLLQTKETLVTLTEEQKRLREQQMQNEIELKESQLSAMTVQMVQKNELLHELKEKLEGNSVIEKDQSINKIINRGLNQDKEWSDFNRYFESINKNFYTRIKQAYPDISPNDLKICALIKMNLSIKEMATILNISPDSVKTARYRLRKKLQLNTEDNLTDFIIRL